MHTKFVRPGTGGTPILRGVRRLGVLALLALVALAPASAWGQLYGRPVAQPCFDFPTWARFSDCRPGPLPWGYDVFPDYGPVDCACENMPPSVACPGDFVAHRPSDWYATADFAPLMLDYQDDVEIARIGPDGPMVLDSGHLQPEFDAGGKFTIGRRIFDCYRLEGTYLGSYDWEDFAIVTGAGDLSTFLSDFSDPPTPGLDNNTAVSIAMQSSLESGEINLRYWANMPPGPFDVSYLVGVRYLRIREQFNFFGESAAATNDLQFNTDNEMIGVQIGIAGAFLKTTRFWMDVDLKGGMYNNHITTASSLIQDGVETANLGDEVDRTTWVGDFSVVGNWQMTPQWTFRLGYQAMFIGGLALAQEQNVGPLFTNVPGPTNHGGELCYHGPIIGLTWMR